MAQMAPKHLTNHEAFGFGVWPRLCEAWAMPSLMAASELATSTACRGRRPRGLAVWGGPSGASLSLPAWLAECAHLEAASVIAFQHLEQDLRQLGAPPSMVASARRARADVIRHAREMTTLARRFGQTPPKVDVVATADRSPFEVALENAVEGCVRETYGALVVAYQAESATDPEIRSVAKRIARDEARHVALAHEVARWIEPQLVASEREAILRARSSR